MVKGRKDQIIPTGFITKEVVVSHRFVRGGVNITSMSVEELSSIRTGSSLQLTASKSKNWHFVCIVVCIKCESKLCAFKKNSLRGKAEDPGSWRIVLGKHQLKRSETAERIFPVRRIYRHENFRYPTHSELDYDIALVKAATDILPSNFIRYACLPRKQSPLQPGHYCWVTGWGDTRGESKTALTTEKTGKKYIVILNYKFNQLVFPIYCMFMCNSEKWVYAQCKQSSFLIDFATCLNLQH